MVTREVTKKEMKKEAGKKATAPTHLATAGRRYGRSESCAAADGSYKQY